MKMWKTGKMKPWRTKCKQGIEKIGWRRLKKNPALYNWHSWWELLANQTFKNANRKISWNNKNNLSRNILVGLRENIKSCIGKTQGLRSYSILNGTVTVPGILYPTQIVFIKSRHSQGCKNLKVTLERTVRSMKLAEQEMNQIKDLGKKL